MKDEKNIINPPPCVSANRVQRDGELAAPRPHREYLATERNLAGSENFDQ